MYKYSIYSSGIQISLFAILVVMLTACGGSDGGEDNDASTFTLTLEWDASQDYTVVGYKVYYNTSYDSFPVGVFGANEGTSPLDIRENTATTISGLSSDEIHYFTVTAYDDLGNESIFSNIVSSQ